MPCYQVNKIAVEFNLKHFGLIEKAAQSLGWKVRKADDNSFHVASATGLYMVTIKQGTASYTDSQAAYVNQLKKAYSKQALNYAAQKSGWVKQVSGNNKLAFVKRGY